MREGRRATAIQPPLGRRAAACCRSQLVATPRHRSRAAACPPRVTDPPPRPPPSGLAQEEGEARGPRVCHSLLVPRRRLPKAQVRGRGGRGGAQVRGAARGPHGVGRRVAPIMGWGGVASRRFQRGFHGGFTAWLRCVHRRERGGRRRGDQWVQGAEASLCGACASGCALLRGLEGLWEGGRVRTVCDCECACVRVCVVGCVVGYAYTVTVDTCGGDVCVVCV